MTRRKLATSRPGARLLGKLSHSRLRLDQAMSRARARAFSSRANAANPRNGLDHLQHGRFAADTKWNGRWRLAPAAIYSGRTRAKFSVAGSSVYPATLLGIAAISGTYHAPVWHSSAVPLFDPLAKITCPLSCREIRSLVSLLRGCFAIAVGGASSTPGMITICLIGFLPILSALAIALAECVRRSGDSVDPVSPCEPWSNPDCLPQPHRRNEAGKRGGSWLIRRLGAFSRWSSLGEGEQRLPLVRDADRQASIMVITRTVGLPNRVRADCERVILGHFLARWWSEHHDRQHAPTRRLVRKFNILLVLPKRLMKLHRAACLGAEKPQKSTRLSNLAMIQASACGRTF
jgi:hypothetical protein